jgi:hypothetical protein
VLGRGGVNVVTVENPVERRLPGVVQVQTHERAGLTFAAALRAILRQDPDVVLVGEVRDHETALVAAQAALTGHLVLATVHTVDAVGAVTRLADLGVEPFKVAAALRGVVAQRLVRRLCAACRRPVAAGWRDARLVGRAPEGEACWAPAAARPTRPGRTRAAGRAIAAASRPSRCCSPTPRSRGWSPKGRGRTRCGAPRARRARRRYGRARWGTCARARRASPSSCACSTRPGPESVSPRWRVVRSSHRGDAPPPVAEPIGACAPPTGVAAVAPLAGRPDPPPSRIGS